MKKIVILATVIIFSIIQSVYANNIIYGADIQRANNGDVVLKLDTSYKTKAKRVFEENGNVYFDIKNAHLSDDYKTSFGGDISLVSQQIGSKVRIYLTGENLKNPLPVFTAQKEGMPVDFSMVSIIILSIFIIYLACRFYSATIRLARNKTAIKSPIHTAMNLNRQLYNFDKRPEIVSNKTNSIKRDVYVDFQYAKDRKNIKIAI